ncbi:MAG: L-histidine N(alpha)-methyltransferase [Defluviicoccus sp.]|nr:L-histidine N(alpha)-methyltransferase [Defluviicoccus sp.]
MQENQTRERIRFRDEGPETDDFMAEVVENLSRERKTLPCKFFYDKTGSALFDRICELDEYYPTRTEIALLERHGGEFAELSGPACHVIEFGSGSSVKVKLLLDRLEEPAAYTAIDISRDHLIDATSALAGEFPELDVEAVWADYTQPLAMDREKENGGRRLGFFPGSTIGNFSPDEAQGFLERSAETIGAGGSMLIGVDLKKDEDTLIAAYNDREGVTAAFNANLLARINRELDGDFDLSGFSHDAVYNREHGRIEMHLVSERDQTARVGNRRFDFRAGETIHTENSYKYGIEQFQGMCREARYEPVRAWTDPDGMFSLHYLDVA